ncbi:BURP domain protein USPL1-like [Pistacia vera]|uniref:BURP domain protein USPL1-like n=1 Tax=Pistacia vera TaxID=55513 RepID=UPI0012637AF4|nr:BURP domain protein USPL1-like [Pistacia vera]
MSGTTDDDFRAIATIYLTKSLTRKQNYTITQVPMEVSVPKVMVACHFLSYPYAVFFCHGLDSEHENKLFKVPLVGENVDRVEGLAICHFETSTWDPNFPALRKLGLKPGDPICHFLSKNNIIWVPSSATTQ